MPNNFLEKILVEKKKLNEEKQSFFDSIKNKIGGGTNTEYHLFKKMISKPGQINLIAEIKKASPSKGLLRADFDLMEIAKVYVKEGAAALSVLTEEKYFLGKPMYVKKISDHFHVPVLTKDFIIDEGQIYEARYLGSSAVLLIMAILNDKDCKHLMKIAASLDLDCLVEVHNEEELGRALQLGAEIIGVNNRDLVSFNVDLKTCGRLIPLIPKDKTVVAESGISSFKDVEYLKGLGAHAVLIGETFMKEQDIAKKVKEVMYG